MLWDPKRDKPIETTEPWRLILLKAADLIEQRGHCKHIVTDQSGALCMGGAINLVDTGYPVYFHTRSEAGWKAAKQLHKFCGSNFVDYNNAPATTAADAVAKLRACANAR